MIRVLPFLLYLWLVSLHQVILNDATSIYAATINIPAVVVILIGLYKSELDACWFGFMVGVVTYAGIGDSMGWYVLVMALLGYLTFHVRAKVNLESIYSRVLLVLVGVLIHNVAVLIMAGSDGVFYLLVTGVVTGAVYTAVIAWVFFLFKEGKITAKKLKAIF
ncbi:MAG: hypothetical protein JSV52_11390 [Candidatus Zixiibacteriota bacterium]|nr:MAG: hypothetical protein JSV52_11390 [candidate division Zixibacteria bacterium]